MQQSTGRNLTLIEPVPVQEVAADGLMIHATSELVTLRFTYDREEPDGERARRPAGPGGARRGDFGIGVAGSAGPKHRSGCGLSRSEGFGHGTHS